MRTNAMSLFWFRSWVWGCPSASVEDVVKSFELIVMPGLGDNKLAGCKGCIVFVQSPKVCVVAIASGYNA